MSGYESSRKLKESSPPKKKKEPKQPKFTWEMPEDISVDSGEVSCMTRETSASQKALKSFEGSIATERLSDDVERPPPPMFAPRVLAGKLSLESRNSKASTLSTYSSTTLERRRRLMMWGTLGFALIVGIIITLLFLVGPFKSATDPNAPKVELDSIVELTPREEALMSILGEISPVGLDVKDSAQYKAKEWLLNSDLLHLTPSATTSNETIVQRYVLAVFFHATNGPTTWKNHNWLDGGECARLYWTGISCNDDNQVRAIAFDNAGLEGYIPDELGALTMLENVVLKNHPKITGLIPSTIGNLRKLGQLGLYNNALTGGIPQELYSATNLNYINLKGNQLIGGLTIRIEKLRNLEKLILSDNKLNGPVPIIQMAKTGLRLLSLSNNALEGPIYDQISNIPNLEYLYLDRNKFTGTLPSNFGRLMNLVSLNLDGNTFTGSIPSEIGRARALKFLSMQSNQLTGTLPTEINQLGNLETLNVAANALVGTIPSTGQMDSLANLYMYQNQMTGTLPASLGEMASLEVLFLSSNKFTGPIHPMIGSASTTLKGLYLSNNELQGTIPAELCFLSNLKALFLDTNVLSGEMPACLGALSLLRQLYVFQNKLTGEVPSTFEELRALTGMGLENNYFVGSVPLGICLIRPLQDLWSDCGGDSPEIGCECCSACCPSESCQ